MEVLDKPGKYEDIISYWKSFCECGRTPFWAQLNKWKTFCDRIRERYESQDRFSDYSRKVNERRRRHKLEGNADLLLERTQQSRLDDWMKYQNFYLQSRESLEVQFKEAKKVLDASQKELDEAKDPRFEDVVEQINSDFSEHFWPNQRANEGKLRKARTETKLAEQEVGLLKDPSKAAELDEIPQRAQVKAVSAMTRLENAKKSENKFLLRRKVLDAVKRLASIKRDLKWNKIMVDWVEQQYQMIASSCATSIHATEGNNNQGLAKNARSQHHNITLNPAYSRRMDP